jgi:surface antigen
MTSSACLFPLAAAGATAFALVAAIFVPYDYAVAADASMWKDNAPAVRQTSPLPDRGDEYTALEALQLALSEIADGGSYIWTREQSTLSGVVKPVASFKDTHGAPCRHAIVVLRNAAAMKRTEIVACRLATGIWQIES